MNPEVLFIKGPIPFIWLMSANQISPSAGLIGVSLWFYVGLNKKYEFKIDGKLDKLTGLSRQTRQMALSKLHNAGLINMTRNPGAYPHIKIIPPGGGRSEIFKSARIPEWVPSFNVNP